MSRPHDKPARGPDEQNADAEPSEEASTADAGVAPVMVTLNLHPDEATLEAVANKLEIALDQMDDHFGVVLIDPSQSQYAILVEPGIASSLREAGRVEGIFSNPPIRPFDM